MKADLDRLMESQGIDAIVLLAAENPDPYRSYLANGAEFSGITIKKRGDAPVLIANGMEMDEAAKSGLKVYNNEDFGLSDLMREYGREHDLIQRAFFRRIFEKLGINGKVTVYGVGDVNAAFRTILNLSEGLTDIVEFVPAEVRTSIFDQAYETKDEQEIRLLREAAKGTSAAMCAAREWIASHHAQDGIVVQEDGSPLTIGDVKKYVRARLFEFGLEDPKGMIFAQGRDSGMPHSTGANSDPLRLGQTIVFDLYPRLQGSYFHDTTRTWAIGYATPEAQAAYDAVMEAYRRSAAMCKPGLSTRAAQVMVCEYFESLGYKTVLNSPGTQEGYVHSLAHGLGLNVHEAPYFPPFTDTHTMQVGNVFTLEPGLYYPEKGFGVRIEDTVYLNEQGEIEVLTDIPYDLVIELKDSNS